MTTDKLPKVDESATDGSKKVKASSGVNGPAVHSAAEDVIKQSVIASEGKPGMRMKFVPKSKAGKLSLFLGGLVGLVIVTLLVMIALGGGQTKKNNNQSALDQVVLKDLEPNNNSAGYLQSPSGNFNGYSLDLSSTQPRLLKSVSYEANLGQQITWDDGFVILAASVERDYRPASEFSYKKIAESGDELVRVNFLVGNASSASMPIGYEDLALYALDASGNKVESERISEDNYSPKDGQLLGAKQTQRVSLHYRVKRGAQFDILKSKTFIQNGAKVKQGEEKSPTLSLKINL